MNTSTIIEAVGYLGSALVLVSFLMSSVVKLRVVNTAGSLIFALYALIIHHCHRHIRRDHRYSRGSTDIYRSVFIFYKRSDGR